MRRPSSMIVKTLPMVRLKLLEIRSGELFNEFNVLE